MRMMLIGVGMAALALAGCSGGGAANNAAANQAAPANAAVPGNETANAAQGLTLPIDEARLVETCIPAADRERAIEDIPVEQRTRIITCLNAENARQLSARLPARIDSRTLVERVTAEGPVLTHHYRVTVRLADLPAGIGDQFEASARTMLCSDPEVGQLFALGGVQVYRWLDSEDALIREVRVERC
jgi:hypothetical protein